MADIRDLSWEIRIPDNIDWLYISPLEGTGYTRINVNIVDGQDPSTEAEITLYCMSCGVPIEKKLKILRCENCECDDFDLFEVPEKCNCDNLTFTKLITCTCNNLTIDKESLSFDYPSSTQHISITKDCELPMTYVAEVIDGDDFIEITPSEIDTGIDVSVTDNKSESPRDGEIGIKLEGKDFYCFRIPISQSGKPCDCDKLTFEPKNN